MRLTLVTRTATVATILAVLGGACGCGSVAPTADRPRAQNWAAVNPNQPEPLAGTVRGRVAGFGGPYPGRTFAPGIAGTVTLTSGGHRYVSTYDAAGHFVVVLPPGIYRMTASAFDGLTCTGTVHLAPHRSTDATAVCPLP